MQGRYEVEELLKLRASPLVVKPSSLPPKEEWMGPAEIRARTLPGRTKGDDSFSQNEGFQKRPTLFDSSRRSTTDPERIHLGPPRSSFASSNARTRNGLHERTKTDDGELKSADRKNVGLGSLNSKIGARDEDESGGHERPKRYNDDEDANGRPARREHDKPRWAIRDSQSDTPWTRREKRDEEESPVWRRGLRDRDIEKLDDPEWAETVEPSEPAKAHTHEDFLQWMEKMKNKNTPEDQPPQLSQPEMVQKEPVAALERPPARIVSDSASVDKFFAKFEEKKIPMENQAPAPPKKSKFAALFGTKEESKPESEASAPNTASQSTSKPPLPLPQPSQQAPAELEQPPSLAQVDPVKKENDAAFARVLAMLGNNQASAVLSTPQQFVQNPVNIAELAATRSPDLVAAPSPHPPSNRTPVTTHTPNLSLDHLLESRSPAQHGRQNQPGPEKATAQDLLSLLRRTNMQDPQPPQQQSTYLPQREQRLPYPPPGFGHGSSREPDRPGPPLISTRRDQPRSIFDDPAFTGYRGDQPFQPQNPPPSETNGRNGLGGLFASMSSQAYVQNMQEEPRQAPLNPPLSSHRPPPGLDNGGRPVPSGWPANPLPRQAVPQFSADVQRSLYDHSLSAYQHAQQQQPQTRQMLQRRPTNEVLIPPGFANAPPGFGPSPVYASPTSPDSLAYAMRPGYSSSDRQRLQALQQEEQFTPRLQPMYQNQQGARGVQLPPGFR